MAVSGNNMVWHDAPSNRLSHALPDGVRAGIKTAAALARCGGRLGPAEILAQTEIAPSLLGLVLAALHRDGLVYRNGAAYGLALPCEEITIAQIVRALEGHDDGPDSGLGGHGVCRVEQFARRLDAGIAAVLDNYSLAEAVSERRIPDPRL